MNLRAITENHGADQEIGSLTKSILKPYGNAAAKPTARKLNFNRSPGFFRQVDWHSGSFGTLKSHITTSHWIYTKSSLGNLKVRV